MKKIETTNIAGAAGMPIIKATHDQWNENTAEVVSALVLGLIGSYTTGDLIILYGCVVSVTGGSIPGTGTATLTAGAIYYNGEIYYVDANPSLATTNPQTLIWEVVTTYRSGDPIEWSDGTPRNQHREDKLRLSAGTPGSGLANYDGATVKYLERTASANGTLTAAAVSNAALVSAQYNAIRKNNMATISMRVVFTVTTGATLATVTLNTITGISLLASSLTNPVSGTFHIRNNTTNAYLDQSVITNGLNSTDVSIDSSRRVLVSLTGALVSNGDEVEFVFSFTGECSV